MYGAQSLGTCKVDFVAYNNITFQIVQFHHHESISSGSLFTGPSFTSSNLSCPHLPPPATGSFHSCLGLALQFCEPEPLFGFGEVNGAGQRMGKGIQRICPPSVKRSPVVSDLQARPSRKLRYRRDFLDLVTCRAFRITAP